MYNEPYIPMLLHNPFGAIALIEAMRRNIRPRVFAVAPDAGGDI
jgi:hypothetical protein